MEIRLIREKSKLEWLEEIKNQVVQNEAIDTHTFIDDALVAKYGVNAAMLLCKFRLFMLNRRAIYQGRYWIYFTKDELIKILSFWGYVKIKNQLNKLIEDGLLYEGTFIKTGFEPNYWYSFTDDLLKDFPELIIPSKNDGGHPPTTNSGEESPNTSTKP
ncbi:hypothetical protein [Maridesulfovibrio sp.]|uniref:hypothetical protein n=1 Tax=Maridesulfovibrio sp. TaxID=2795000 RepID=UPI003BAB2966